MERLNQNGCNYAFEMHDYKSIKKGELILLLQNGNRRSHNTENGMPQVFINSRSGRVKGSHKSPYVTVLNTLNAGYSEKSKLVLVKTGIQSSKHLARAMYKWRSRGGQSFKSSGEGAMALLAGVSGFLLLIAVIYIAVERLTTWLSGSGGFTMRIKVDEGEN
jgi:hypothetical protein